MINNNSKILINILNTKYKNSCLKIQANFKTTTFILNFMYLLFFQNTI